MTNPDSEPIPSELIKLGDQMVTRFDEMGLLLSDLPTEMGDRMLAALVTGKTVLIVASFKGGRAVRMYASETPAHSALTDTLAAVANRTKK